MDPVHPQPKSNSSARHKNRLCAVQFLYMWTVNPSDSLTQSLFDFFKLMEEPREFYNFAQALICATIENLSSIDEVIQSHVKHWTFDRINKVDLSILRLAIYELLYRTDIPPVVSINEAIELSKELSTPDSKRFINGVLDKTKEGLTRPLRKADNT